MSRLARLTRDLARGLARAAVLGLLVLAVGTTIDVVMRYAFARPIPGFGDVTALGGAVLLAACMPWVVASRSNIVIDLLGRAAGRRTRRRLDAFGEVLAFVFFAVLAWQYVGFALDMYRSGERMAILRWPVWPWWTGVAACIAVTAWVALMSLVDRSDAR